MRPKNYWVSSKILKIVMMGSIGLDAAFRRNLWPTGLLQHIEFSRVRIHMLITLRLVLSPLSTAVQPALVSRINENMVVSDAKQPLCYFDACAQKARMTRN